MSDAGTMYANAKALHELLQESRAENAELRKERDALDRLTDVLDATNDGLLAENEKLRELVRNVEHYERFGCQGCPNARGCTAPMLYDERCSMRQEIDNDKRELGIEVDA